MDLSPALPELSVPRAAWRAATARARPGVSDDQLGHPDPAGTPQLRRTLADYLRRVRALDLPADGSAVLITQGVGNAVDLICRQLATAGARRVAIENPSWPRLRQIVAGNGLDAVPIGVDGEGLRVEELLRADAEQRIDAVFAMPTHQFPTGVPLSAGRRVALVRWAATGGRWIIEDDYDAEFRYDRRPGAVAALAPDQVAYLGSVSKTLSPALHLGWMVAPSRLLAGIASARAGLGALTPTIEQLALVDLITSGAYDRHLRRMRRRYQLRRRALLEALHRQVPGEPAEHGRRPARAVAPALGLQRGDGHRAVRGVRARGGRRVRVPRRPLPRPGIRTPRTGAGLRQCPRTPCGRDRPDHRRRHRGLTPRSSENVQRIT